MRILITGSSGFIGFHLSNLLLKKKNKIIGLDNHNSYYSSSIKLKRLSILRKKKLFKFFKINLLNKKKVKKIFELYKPEIIFHLAGQPGVLYSFKNPKSYYDNNVVATKNLCKLAKEFNVKKFIFASSSSVYGDQKKYPISENAKLNPKNPYALTKRKSEKIVFSILEKKIKFVIFRFFTVYGPLGRPDMFIHKLLNSIKKNSKIYLHNNGLNFRDFTYIDDVTDILNLSINKDLNKSIINICRSNPIRTDVLLKIIKKLYKLKKFNITKIKSVRGEMLKTHGSNRKLKNIFKKKKFKNFNEGLKKTVNYYKKFGY